MSVLFFLASAVFWILKPIKKGVFISHFKDNVFEIGAIRLGGAESEQLAKLTLVFAALLAAVLLAAAARRFSLRKIFLSVSVLAALGTLYFAVRLPVPDDATIWFFYLFGDIQYSLLVILLWSISHNSFRIQEAKFAFTWILISGLAGGLGGTFIVHQYLGSLGMDALISFCMMVFLMIAFLGFRYLCKPGQPRRSLFSAQSCEVIPVSSDSEKKSGGFAFPGKSKYWIAIALLVGLYELTSGIIDFQLSLAVENISGDKAQRTMYFGYVGAAQNLVALLVQILFTGYVIRQKGVKTALMVLPLTILLGSVGFLFLPGLAGAMFLSVSDNGLNYSVNQQAKETLYLPTARGERFRAKAFIDLFVQRFAKIGAVALNLLIVSMVGINASRWLAAAAIPVLLIWIAVVQYTGKEFENLSPGT